MELIPIIEASLSIFTVFTAFFVILSYLLYKLRGKSDVKQPYLEELAADNRISIVVEKSRIVENDIIKLQRFERFKVLNPVLAPHLDEDTNEDEPNEKISVTNSVMESFRASNVILKPRPIDYQLNIYKMYSNSSLRPMHKLKAKDLSKIIS